MNLSGRLALVFGISGFGAATAPHAHDHPALAPAAPALRLDAVISSNEPLAAAFSPDGARLFAIEGTDLVELAEEPGGWHIVDSVPVEAEAAGLHVTHQRIFLAGGSAGCVAVDYGAGLGAPRTIATEPGMQCADVATDGTSVAVLFRNYARTTVHVLAASDLHREQRVRLTGGSAQAIEILGSEVYLAEGSRGLRHVPLRSERPAAASRLLALVDGSFARDLARTGHQLWVAAGRTGLVRIDLEQRFGAQGATRVLGLGDSPLAGQALRVAAAGERVALAISALSAAEADALPGGLLGAPGPPQTWRPHRQHPAAAVALWEQDGDELRSIASPALTPGRWRSLALSTQHLLVQRTHDGLRTAELATAPAFGPARRLSPPVSPKPTAPLRVHAFGQFAAIRHPAAPSGLAVYARAELNEADADPPPFASLPAAILRNPGAPESGQTLWACDSLPMGRGRWLLVCAAGAGASAEDPDLARPRMLTFLVDASGARLLAETLGSDGPGLATSVAVFEERGRHWALLASLGGQLELFDLSDPAQPRSVVHQPMTPSAWDAVPPALTGVEVVQFAGYATQAVVSAGRAGLLRLDLGELQNTPPHPDLIPDEVFDTPGWAAGVQLAPSPVGGQQVIVDDQRSGTRIYRWIFGQPAD